MKSFPTLRLLLLSLVLTSSAGSSLRADTVYDLNTDAFSFPDNPGGTNDLFSYGTKTSATAIALTLYDVMNDTDYGSLDVYYSSTSPTGVDPNVVFNPTDDVIDFGPGDSS